MGEACVAIRPWDDMVKTASSMGDKPGETLMVFMVLNGGKIGE